jgi:hypothetical protein
MSWWDNRQFIAAIGLRRRALQPDEPEIEARGACDVADGHSINTEELENLILRTISDQGQRTSNML